MHEICKRIGIDKPNRGQTMRLAEAIRRYNGGQKPHRSNGLNHHYVPDTKDYAPDTDSIHRTADSTTEGHSTIDLVRIFSKDRPMWAKDDSATSAT